MGEYWKTVARRALVATIPYGFDPKKLIASACVASAGLLAAYFVGAADAKSNIVKALWYALFLFLAGMIIFAWNFVLEQAKMCREVADQLATFGKPDYDSIKMREEFRLSEAACFWCDIAPKLPLPTAQAEQWLRTFVELSERGKLEIVPKLYYQYQAVPVAGGTAKVHHPSPSTVVTRKSLAEYAKKLGTVPRFLQDDDLSPGGSNPLVPNAPE